MKAVRDDADLPANMEPPISACVYHRCKDHFKVPALNATESDGAECGACIGEEVRFVEREQLWPVLEILGSRLIASAIRKVHLQRCIDRLNFLVPGAGDQMLQELAEDFKRHTLRRQWIDGRHDPELRGEWLKLAPDHPMHLMALAIEKELWEASGVGATDGGPGPEHHDEPEDGAHPRAGGGQAVREEPEEDPERGSS